MRRARRLVLGRVDKGVELPPELFDALVVEPADLADCFLGQLELFGGVVERQTGADGDRLLNALTPQAHRLIIGERQSACRLTRKRNDAARARMGSSVARADASYLPGPLQRVANLGGRRGTCLKQINQRESVGDVTTAHARLSGLDIDISHQKAPGGEWEEVSITLRAAPSFEALGSVFAAADPFALWSQAAKLMWMPWLIAAQPMLLSGGARLLPEIKR